MDSAARQCAGGSRPAQDRPALAPGVHVVARGRDQFQIGLADGVARVLPRTEPVLRAVSVLTEAAEVPADPAARQVLDELVDAGLVTGPAPGHAGARVRVQGSLGPPAEELLEATGLVPVRREGADVAVLFSRGELDRAELDPLIRHRLPHLVVRAFDGVVVLGPFVVPGHTACLSCLDGHRSDEDPAHPAVLERYIRADALMTGPEAEAAIDPLMALLATAWAVRDLATWITHGRPSTWSSTITLGRRLTEVQAQSWLRHPECGCSWLEPSGTMDS